MLGEGKKGDQCLCAVKTNYSVKSCLSVDAPFSRC